MVGETGRGDGMPRWVKVTLIVAAILALLVVVLLLTGGHGPGRHAALTVACHGPDVAAGWARQ